MPDPFIALQDLTDYLGRNVNSDNGAVIAIDAACSMVRTVAERQFNAGTATIALDGMDTDAVLIPNQYLPINSAGTVTVNGTAVTEYMLTGNGILLRGTAGIDPRPTWPAGRQNVTATIDHGYGTATLPRDVKMVALSIASRLVVQGAATEESLGDARVKYAAASTDLTNGEKLILGKYRGIR